MKCVLPTTGGEQRGRPEFGSSRRIRIVLELDRMGQYGLQSALALHGNSRKPWTLWEPDGSRSILDPSTFVG